LSIEAAVPSPTPVIRRGVTDYAELLRRVKSAGLLDHRPVGAAAKILLVVGLYVAGWTALVLGGASWWQLFTAAFLGVMFTQLGFLGHDVGHRQVFGGRRAAYAFGLLAGNLGIGLSFGWWMDKHTRHHAHPNDLVRDPDVGIGALVFDAGQARGRTGVAKVLTSFQAYLFFPMLLLEGFQLHVASTRAIRSSRLPSRSLEAALLLLHVAGYLAVVLWVLPLDQALVFAVVQQAVFGMYMGLSFAPNHKGMPAERPGDNWDFLRRQVLTSRNVHGGPVVDLLLGGLNYQIEHHLFPSMPRPSLRRAQPLVRSFCAERGVSYAEHRLVSSYVRAVGHLNAVGHS
jgi:fatty acid desaturase